MDNKEKISIVVPVYNAEKFLKETIECVSEDVFNKSKKASHGDIVMAVTSENVEDGLINLKVKNEITIYSG